MRKVSEGQLNRSNLQSLGSSSSLEESGVIELQKGNSYQEGLNKVDSAKLNQNIGKNRGNSRRKAAPPEEEKVADGSATEMQPDTEPLATLSKLAAEATPNRVNEMPMEKTVSKIPPSQSQIALPQTQEINKRKRLKSSHHSSSHRLNKMERRRSDPFGELNNASNAVTSTSKSHGTNSLRRGKWTAEEEAYVGRVIRDFNYGYLDTAAGTTLRSYLAEKLQCDPMRITKKFTGEACIGKRVFHPAVRCVTNSEAIDRAQTELLQLEKRWKRRLEIQQREASKKAPNINISSHIPMKTSSSLPLISTSSANSATMLKNTNSNNYAAQNVLERTATWLDRANNILANRPLDNNPSEFQRQIDEVKQLIFEGPIIQKTSAGIPKLLGKEQNQQQLTLQPFPDDQIEKKNPNDNIDSDGSASSSEKLCQSFSNKCSSDIKEVETLVGFFNCVRRETDSQK